MTRRRDVLAALGVAGLAAGAWTAGAFGSAMVGAEDRLALRSTVVDTSAGALEYAVAGRGEPLLMIHGTGGGFDQGLLFAHRLVAAGRQVVAPSRFGYLASDFPEDASPARQADVLVELLDRLGIDRLPVVGGSAGALSAAELAIRHPDRCSRLVLLVPAANLADRDPVAFTPLQRAAVEVVLGSDLAFWALARLAPGRMMRTLLATDPALLDRVDDAERRRAETILRAIQPIGRKARGLRADALWAGSPSEAAYDRIAAPTLLLSTEDDLFGTAATARLLAARIPKARLVVLPDGGHIWLGRDRDVANEILAFLAPDAATAPATP